MGSKKFVSGWRGKLALVLAAALAPAAGLGATEAYAATASSQGQWIQSGSRWWYRNADGTYPVSCWEEIGGDWYHFDASGWMQTGWLYDGGSWYYLLSSRKMVTDDAQTINGVGYAFDSSGRMLANASFGFGSSPTVSYVVYFDANGS